MRIAFRIFFLLPSLTKIFDAVSHAPQESLCILPLVLLLFVSPAFSQDPASPQAEHLSPYGLKGKFLLLNGEKPKDLLDGEMLTVVDVKKGRLPAGLQLLNKVTEEPKPGSVGIHIPSEAYLLIDSRKMTNVGKGKITIRLAKSKNREARHIDLEGKRSADYNEMRRARRIA